MNAPLQHSPVVDAALTIRSVNVRSVVVPLVRPVVTANGAVSSAPLVLLDIETNSGVTGRAYSFAYSPAFLPALASLTGALARSIVDSTLAPQTIEAQVRSRFTLLGGAANLAAFAISAIDMAAWDALAKHLKLPLATVLGSSPKTIKAYAGNGVGVIDANDVPASVDAVLADGVRAIKLRLGRADAALDIHAVETAKTALASCNSQAMPVMVDFNQSLSVAEAVLRCRALDAFDLTWIEEPTRCDDWIGNARIAHATHTPIQLGENIASAHALQTALSSQAMDFAMLDLQQLGGVTGWMRAASVAQTFGAPISSHLFQEFSAHMLSVTAGADWLEYFPLADPILANRCRVIDGCVQPIAGDGAGIEWNEGAVSRFLA
jgi:mandelate racemase